MYPLQDLPAALSRQIYEEMLAYADGQVRFPDWIFDQPHEPHSISREERIQGLAALWAEARVSFAYWDNVPDLDWDAAFREFLPRVIAAEDPGEYYRLLRRFLVLLQDGHTYVHLPPWLRKQEAPPRLRLFPVEGLPVVVEGEGLPPGSVVTRVDGHPAGELLAEIMADEPASTQAARLRQACSRLLYGPAGSTVVVGARLPDGREVEAELLRDGPLPAPPLVERVELGGGRLLVRINSWADPAVVEQFHAAVGDFAGVRALIIDLRRNGGGNSEYGKAVLGRLIDRPAPATVDRLPMYCGAMNTLMGLPRPQLCIEDTPAQPDPERPRFSGPVAVLTSTLTYSASEDFCVAFRNSRRGWLVGTPTGGSTGNPAVVPLPGGGRGMICAQRATYPDGTPFVGRGVQPDVRVAPSIAGIAEGRDEVLEEALRCLSV